MFQHWVGGTELNLVESLVRTRLNAMISLSLSRLVIANTDSEYNGNTQIALKDGGD